MYIIKRSFFVLFITWSLSTMAAENRIEHHRLTVDIDPMANSLSAVDVIDIRGDDHELLLYLGATFSWKEIIQGKRILEFKRIEEGGKGKAARYHIKGWHPGGLPLTAKWEGTLAEFSGYGVSIIRPDLVELSGFCSWFPTIQPSSQSELFTYSMTLNMPEAWVVLSPQDREFRALAGGKMEFAHEESRTEDVFICASPGFRRYVIGGKGSPVFLYSLPRGDLAPIIEDFESVVSLCTKWFGEPVTAESIVAIISPRRGGAEWGYERGPFWVTGDGFADYLLANDWEIKGLKKSLAAHETIHTWFGKSVRFEQAYLKEAVTQYLEVIVSAQLFDQEDLPDRYFDWYRMRFMASEAGIDLPISDLSIDGNHYDHWYLKGSWAFWDLEALLGRKALLAALGDLNLKHGGTFISGAGLIASLEGSLEKDLRRWFRHWFYESGFQPLYRVDSGENEEQ